MRENVMGMKDDKAIFNVLFMGDFKNGKSTTINALIGDELLPISACDVTAVICKVVYGKDAEHIKVFKNGAAVQR